MYKYQQITPYLTIETSRPLGRGGFGCVYNGQYQGNPVAVKELKRSLDNRSENTYFLPEVQLSERLKNEKCDNLVKIIDVFPTASEIQLNQYPVAYIVMELCSGDLRGFLKEQNGRIDMYHGIYIMRQIAEGVKALHSLGIAHRDIKPENVFCIKYNADWIFKLGDFGLGKSENVVQTQIGTISYMAPEMLNFNAQSYSSKVDIWALGVMTHEIITGVNLFPGTNPPAVRQNILKMTSYLSKRNEAKNQVVMSNDILAQSFRMITRDEVASLIDAMLQPDPDKRNDITDICAQMEYVLQALQNPEQGQPQNQQSNDAARQGYVVTQIKQNRGIGKQGDQPAEKIKADKLKSERDTFEVELYQTQQELKKAKYNIEELQARIQTVEISSQVKIDQLEKEKKELVKEKQELVNEKQELVKEKQELVKEKQELVKEKQELETKDQKNQGLNNTINQLVKTNSEQNQQTHKLIKDNQRITAQKKFANSQEILYQFFKKNNIQMH